jgi:hypothetical protein
MASLRRKDVVRQLKEQNVRLILLREILEDLGSLELVPIGLTDYGFCISIRDARPYDLLSVAHELGHTFECCLEGEWFPHWRQFLREGESAHSQYFAIAFADQWLSVRAHQEQLMFLLDSSKDSVCAI